jgi:hypothetical protein
MQIDCNARAFICGKKKEMKADIKQIDQSGSLTFVQFSHGERATLDFRPGPEAMKSGRLIIQEASETGVVGTLKAENRSDDFLLLTDADILKGAKQNRMINKSLLLAPRSRVLVDVSCVEQSRWRDVSDRFEPSTRRVDFSLRAKKSASRSKRGQSLQSEVWETIGQHMMENKFHSATMDYNELAGHMEKKGPATQPVIDPAAGSTGLVVIENGKVRCVDIFGREEVYLHYFEGLVQAARRGSAGKGSQPVETEQVRQWVDELVDALTAAKAREDANYLGAGCFEHLTGAALTGNRLSYGSDLVHVAGFGV